MMEKLRRLLGLVEGHEDKVAEQVSKRTSVSEEKAKEGINKAQEAVNNDAEDRNRSWYDCFNYDYFEDLLDDLDAVDEDFTAIPINDIPHDGTETSVVEYTVES